MPTVLEVADIFRRHGEAYRRSHEGHLGRVERRVMSAIELCRTAELGGHSEYCASCGFIRCAYNSCRNRHCPKCQGAARREWLAAQPAAFARRLTDVRRVEWVVYAKPPFGGSEQVLAYLARYTHRVAISNSRLVSLTDDSIVFRWKDYRHHDKTKVMALAAFEFIRRFLLHTLPDGFHRIRHYGFLANGHRAEKLALCRKAVATSAEPSPSVRQPREKAGIVLSSCPCCGGTMIELGPLPRSMPCHPSFSYDSS